MAGDWMKIEKVTPDKPEIEAIACTLDIDPDAVFGKCFRVWSWFDDHTVDGNAPSVSLALVDRKCGVSGFGAAMIQVGWLIEVDGGLTVPNFDRHCGKSAKNRALTAKRVAKHASKTNATANGKLTLDALPREEKRREEKSKKESSKPKRFTPPTVDEVRKYCSERKNRVDAERFVNHYTANGWKVGGKATMKDWRAAVRTWEGNEFNGGGGLTANQPDTVKTREQILKEAGG